MRTVSLRRRVVGIGGAVLAFVGVDAFVWVNVRAYLVANLKRTLENRAALADSFAPTIDPTELARLAGSEVIVLVRDHSGRGIERGVPDDEEASQPLGAPLNSGSLSRQVSLPNGDTVVLVASQKGVDRMLRQVVVSEIIGTLLGLGVAVFLLTRAARVPLRPIDTVVFTARRISSGHTGERLRPDRTDTELGRMALVFDEMLDGLEAALAEAHASEEAERRFLAEAAHQLRTPIAGIPLSVEALPSAQTPAERDELVAHVAKESTRTGRRVDALLGMARLDRGGAPTRTRCDGIALCQDEVERTACWGSRLDIRVHSEESPITAEIDPDAVREALANLLDNARRHARSSNLLTVSMGQRHVELRVHDDGPGVPPGNAERVFEPFVSLDEHRGAGLGLSIVRAIARNHSGDASYEDGAFVIRLSHPSSPASFASQETPKPTAIRR